MRVRFIHKYPLLTGCFSLRLGTFNVNGKMPSQDLSPWVRRSVNLGDPNAGSGKGYSWPELPPLKNMSPLSLGEVARNPFTWGAHVSTLN